MHTTRKGETPLHLASSAKAARDLLERERELYGESPLASSMLTARTNRAIGGGNSLPLHVHAARGRSAVVSVLLSFAVGLLFDIDLETDGGGNTPLMLAPRPPSEVRPAHQSRSLKSQIPQFRCQRLNAFTKIVSHRNPLITSFYVRRPTRSSSTVRRSAARRSKRQRRRRRRRQPLRQLRQRRQRRRRRGNRRKRRRRQLQRRSDRGGSRRRRKQLRQLQRRESSGRRW